MSALNRRELIALAGVALPVAAHGQQAMPVIGFLSYATAPSMGDRVAAFGRIKSRGSGSSPSQRS
jgi:hypothetical protein